MTVYHDSQNLSILWLHHDTKTLNKSGLSVYCSCSIVCGMNGRVIIASADEWCVRISLLLYRYTFYLFYFLFVDIFTCQCKEPPLRLLQGIWGPWERYKSLHMPH